MIRIVVAAPPAVQSPGDLRDLAPCADLVELRLDLLPAALDDASRLGGWITACPRPVMATVRSVSEGGAFRASPADAAALLMAAARAGAAWIDVEADVASHVTTLPDGVRVVASYHGEGDPDLPREVAGRPVDAWKIARPVRNAAQWTRLREESRGAQRVDPPRTFVPFGPLGALRAACLHGGALLYGSALEGEGVVPGQPSLRVLLDELRVGDAVDADADLFGLLGKPPARSPSPALHNAAFRATGRHALYVPLPGLEPRDAMALPFRGLSVTTPWKQTVLAGCASVDDAVREVGAANTLLRLGDGGWHARNTDVEAVADAVPDAEPGQGAAVYGSGGYARAVVVALRRRGYAVRLCALEDTGGPALAAEMDVAWDGNRFARRAEDRVVVNATPLGSDGAPPAPLLTSPLDDLLVLDAPYRRDGAPTGLVEAARGRARRVVTGLDLLLLQALGQARAFTGIEVDREVLEVALDPPAPLVLLGLRGAGKSRVGAAVAERLGRPFVDLDDEVTRVTGRDPASWIEESGESAFRAVESEAVARLVGRRGVVVAAGGGVLERPENADVLRNHTVPVLLSVSADVAAARVRGDSRSRPLLGGAEDPETEARVLLERRDPAWRRVAQHVVDADAAVDEVAERVTLRWIRAAR